MALFESESEPSHRPSVIGRNAHHSAASRRRACPQKRDGDRAQEEVSKHDHLTSDRRERAIARWMDWMGRSVSRRDLRLAPSGTLQNGGQALFRLNAKGSKGSLRSAYR